jgi:hypothetical protein
VSPVVVGENIFMASCNNWTYLHLIWSTIDIIGYIVPGLMMQADDHSIHAVAVTDSALVWDGAAAA